MGMRCALVVAVTVASGCATTSLDPALFHLGTIAIASVHARSAIEMHGVPTSSVDNTLGTEALEMELGENEGRLADMFGVDVVPVGKAMLSRAYNGLPEALPAQSYSQLAEMIAVDIDAPATPAALGSLARSLDVDAVVVVRHEWSVAKDPTELGAGITALDRCSILVVAKRGDVLWKETTVAKSAKRDLGLSLASALAGGDLADDARTLARTSGRAALDALIRKFRVAHAASVQATKSPP